MEVKFSAPRKHFPGHRGMAMPDKFGVKMGKSDRFGVIFHAQNNANASFSRAK